MRLIELATVLLLCYQFLYNSCEHNRHVVSGLKVLGTLELLEQRNSERKHPSACFVVLCVRRTARTGQSHLWGLPPKPFKGLQGPGPQGLKPAPRPRSNHRQGTVRKKTRTVRTKRAKWGEDKCVVRKKLPAVRKKMPHCHPRSKSRYTVPYSHIKRYHGQKKIHGQKKAVHGQKKRRSPGFWCPGCCPALSARSWRIAQQSGWFVSRLLRFVPVVFRVLVK